MVLSLYRHVFGYVKEGVMVTGALESRFSDVEKNLQFVHLRERGKDIAENTNSRGLLSHLHFPKRDRKVASDLEYTCL